jgi:hypothetical protein
MKAAILEAASGKIWEARSFAKAAKFEPVPILQSVPITGDIAPHYSSTCSPKWVIRLGANPQLGDLTQ